MTRSVPFLRRPRVYREGLRQGQTHRNLTHTKKKEARMFENANNTVRIHKIEP